MHITSCLQDPPSVGHTCPLGPKSRVGLGVGGPLLAPLSSCSPDEMSDSAVQTHNSTVPYPASVPGPHPSLLRPSLGSHQPSKALQPCWANQSSALPRGFYQNMSPQGPSSPTPSSPSPQRPLKLLPRKAFPDLQKGTLGLAVSLALTLPCPHKPWCLWAKSPALPQVAFSQRSCPAVSPLAQPPRRW
ncbi:hypothetical protein P7K49_005817 [Saguinus oedipus]|uniref:Uncharacterized protein n=1 Tax=Saguinus oedipus TaxID=9490 RepID=A0ABQ9W1F3_SAGOE|nr:hypothetical protein P7K49_005817 [Saguinus oedipus]